MSKKTSRAYLLVAIVLGVCACVARTVFMADREPAHQEALPIARYAQPRAIYRHSTTMPATRPSPDAVVRIKRVIAELDDDDVKVRSAASLRLNSLDGPSVEIVEAALRNPGVSPEAKERLETALRYLRPRVRFERERLLRAAWVERMLHEGYGNGCHADPTWDAQAHRGIDLAIQLGIDPLRGPVGVRDQAINAFADAIDAGCDDPLILCLHGMCQGRVAAGATTFELPSMVAGYSTHVLDGDYPVFVKLYASIGRLNMQKSLDTEICTAPVKLLEELSRETGLPPGELPLLAREYLKSLMRVQGGVRYVEPFLKAYERYAGPIDFRIVRGVTMVDLGEEAQLVEAEKLGIEAWKLDPSDPRGARLMMVVRLAQAAAWDEIDTWFQRAAEANPDALDLYVRKLDCIDEGRAGEQDKASAMLAYGRECLATQNWRAGIPMLLVEAHHRAAHASRDSTEYFSQPEVWADLSLAYEGVLLNFPEDVTRRSEYAKLATQCQRWEVAARQFAVLGDKPDTRVFVSKESYDYLRRKAKRLGAAQ